MRRLIVAITGASGATYGIRALEMLRLVRDIETHLIISSSAARTIVEETNYSVDSVRSLADCSYSYRDIGAAISSGSFKTMGMLVAPCSVKTLSGIASSYDNDLVVRAADVCLKERRRVVLLFCLNAASHGPYRFDGPSNAKWSDRGSRCAGVLSSTENAARRDQPNSRGGFWICSR